MGLDAHLSSPRWNVAWPEADVAYTVLAIVNLYVQPSCFSVSRKQLLFFWYLCLSHASYNFSAPLQSCFLNPGKGYDIDVTFRTWNAALPPASGTDGQRGREEWGQLSPTHALTGQMGGGVVLPCLLLWGWLTHTATNTVGFTVLPR